MHATHVICVVGMRNIHTPHSFLFRPFGLIRQSTHSAKVGSFTKVLPENLLNLIVTVYIYCRARKRERLVAQRELPEVGVELQLLGKTRV